MGNVGRPQGRECWGENGVDDRAVVSTLPANLNPPLVPPSSRRKALERSSFTAAGRVRLKAKGRFVQALALFTFSGGAEPEVNDFLQQRNLPYLVKPFEVADLIAQARRLLQKTHAAAAS